jgi:UDP:flavonoid glycosyltransferase YjiC (YdhE family)
MSRIVMSAAGSWGDVLPFVPVAHVLQMRGHEIEFVVPSGFHERLGLEGFTARSAGWEIGPEDLAALGYDWSKAGGLPFMRAVMRELILPRLAEAHAALEAAADGADLLVCHLNQVMAPIVSARTGVPYAALSLFPMVVPTAEGLASSPMPQLPRPFRRIGNRAIHALGLRASGRFFGDREFNRLRTRLGLESRHAYFFTAALEADRYLALVPPSFVPRPTDWPAHVQLTGFCVWDGGSTATVPDQVEQFLDAGDPPVLVTMGSAGSASFTELLESIATELDGRGLRGLFLVGDERHRGGSLVDRPGVADFAPLSTVLPRCRAVIHHGGYGTTAATLLAGLPAVTVSPMPDQLWYGRRTEALGAGIALSWRQRRRVGAALEHLLREPSYGCAATASRDSLARSDGIADTCDALEAMLPTP